MNTYIHPLTNEELTVGSIISAFHLGYHRITKIVDRSEDGCDSPLIQYVTLLTSIGEKSDTTEELICDAGYCRLANKQISLHIKELQDYAFALQLFAKEHNLS